MRLLSIVASLLFCSPVLGQNPTSLSKDDFISKVSHTLDSLAALDEFSGVVAIAKDGEIVFEGAYGFADREAQIPNTVETAFNIGSINKAFTTIAIRQLAAEGKLDLDSTLINYWPDYPNQEVARSVTIRQLVRHQSGIGGNIFDEPEGGDRLDIRHNRDFVQLFVDNPLEFTPGSDQRYSNAGYVVLGEVIERVSGQDYYEYVEEHIYRPAGMTETKHIFRDQLDGNVAIGYYRPEDALEGSPLECNTLLLPGRGSAAGGGYSTAHDLLRFVQALRERKIPEGPPPGIGVAGGAPGINTVVDGDLPGGYDVVVLSNFSPPTAERIAEKLRGWLGVTD